MSKRSSTLRDRHRAQIKRGRPPCHICGKPIDYDAHHLEPSSFVVDHVVPLALGGADNLGNKRAAHRGCNANKSDKRFGDVIRRSLAFVWPSV